MMSNNCFLRSMQAFCEDSRGEYQYSDDCVIDGEADCIAISTPVGRHLNMLVELVDFLDSLGYDPTSDIICDMNVQTFDDREVVYFPNLAQSAKEYEGFVVD